MRWAIRWSARSISLCFGWASDRTSCTTSPDLAIRVNDFMSGLFAGIGIKLVDFKLEFGRLWDNDYSRIILADEISPDGCRLWDMETGEKLDKDRFRRDLGGEVEAYQDVARRLGLLPEGPDSRRPGPGKASGQTQEIGPLASPSRRRHIVAHDPAPSLRPPVHHPAAHAPRPRPGARRGAQNIGATVPDQPPPSAEVKAAWGLAGTDVQIDPTIRFGLLPNGMKYAIRRNDTPRDTVVVRMNIDRGSLSETDDERGLSHFLEHMAFNGSTNVPEGAM